MPPLGLGLHFIASNFVTPRWASVVAIITKVSLPSFVREPLGTYTKWRTIRPWLVILESSQVRHVDDEPRRRFIATKQINSFLEIILIRIERSMSEI